MAAHSEGSHNWSAHSKDPQQKASMSVLGCAAVTAEKEAIQQWLASARSRETSRGDWSPDVFSYHEYACSEPLLRVPIEPLFGMLLFLASL